MAAADSQSLHGVRCLYCDMKDKLAYVALASTTSASFSSTPISATPSPKPRGRPPSHISAKWKRSPIRIPKLTFPDGYTVEIIDNKDIKRELSVCKRRKISKPLRSHLAYGVWNLSHEQGNQLLASRFRGDCLYICDWPGCIHSEEKRNYMLFRGSFKNFKKSHVWRTINDGNRNKTNLNCAFCSCEQTWDLRSAFCLRRVFGYHDDGEPVVRAYVCENGHVSGAWTDLPLYA